MGAGKRSVSSLSSAQGHLLVLWTGLEKPLPPPPDPDIAYAEDTDEHWYEAEHGLWRRQVRPEWVSPRDGAAGKRVVFIGPDDAPYLAEFGRRLQQKAAQVGVELTLIRGAWAGEAQDAVSQALTLAPDLVLLNPHHLDTAGEQIERLHQAGVPVAACNFLPPAQACHRLLFWTGPDDWGQARALARELARQLGGRGRYAIVRHQPGTSSWYARTWGVITELKKLAPDMECVASEAPGLTRAQVRPLVEGWLRRWPDLAALVVADDADALDAVRDALAAAGAGRVACAAFGSTANGLQALRDGTLQALAYQPPAVDASVALQTAVDWFDGLPVEQVRYLPVCILTPETVDGFLDVDEGVTDVNFDRLRTAIEATDEAGIEAFFADVHRAFVKMRLVSHTAFAAFSLQTVGFFLVLLRDTGLSADQTFGDWETLYKKTLLQTQPEAVLGWFVSLAHTVAAELSRRRTMRTPQAVVAFVDQNFRMPLSLKVLAEHFGLGAVYLGQLFHSATGMKFSDYLALRRITEAKRLLRTTALAAAAVGTEVGFSDPNYFYKVFQRLTGQSVSAFRR